MISREEVLKVLDYDPVTGAFRWKVSRGNVAAGREAGYVNVRRGKSYRHVRVSGTYYPIHRLGWLILTGRFPEDQIDHIDGNGLNNSAENLRAVSNAENARNQRKPVNNKSGVAGVHWDKANAKWRVLISHNGKRKCLGRFDDFDEAVAVRKNAEQKLGFHPNHGSERPL